jgi:anti-sigma factor RsiW
MTCDQLRQKLDAFIDNSIAGEELTAIHAHFQSCPPCAAEALARLQIKRATRTAAARYVPAPAFLLRIENAIQTKRIPVWSLRWVPALAALAIAILLVAVPGALWLRHSSRQQAVAELVDLHVSALASANPVDVVSTDRHTVKPWFQGKLPFTFNLPDFESSPFRLLGGKLEYFGHSPGAHLLVDLRKHEMSVFILQQGTKSLPDTGPVSSRENGFNIESWEQNGLRYLIVSDAGSSDVHTLGNLFRTATSQ